jgi:hypothetical protein
MIIDDYFIKVKNLANVFTSIGTPINDEDLVVVTFDDLGKGYNQF